MFTRLLTAISDVIEQYFNNYYIDTTNKNQELQEVRSCYEELKGKNQVYEFYEFLLEEFKNDNQLLCVIYSILYKVSDDDEILKAMYDLLIKSDFNIFLLNSIRNQLTYKIFMKLTKTSFYEKKLQLHNKMLQQLKNLIGFDVEKIEVSERNQRNVLIVTDQLLNIGHAPTVIVYKISTILKKYFDFQVQVICMQSVISSDVQGYWVNSSFTNGADILGNYYVEPYGEKIPVFFMPMEEKNIENIKQLCSTLYDLKPIFSWYIGGESIVGDFIGQMTTTLSMPCTLGYGISIADFMIAYNKNNSQLIQEQEQYLTKHNQSMLYLKVVLNHREKYIGNLTRKDIGASKTEFLITIVGNRLDNEISDDFLAILSEIVGIMKDVKFVFCGEINRIRQLQIDLMLKGKQYYLGYREDLIDVISLCDLMINPPRVGGGGSARMATAMGIPIISLKNCDVAMVIEEDMCCDTIGDYPELVKRYMMDATFRIKQSNRIKEIYDALGVDQFHQYIKEMLCQVNHQANLGLIL